ncbi:hypothetical protein GCM10009565_52260 [Amycolatopsis albidoflavus]
MQPLREDWDTALEHLREQAAAVLVEHASADGTCSVCCEQQPCASSRCAEFILEL